MQKLDITRNRITGALQAEQGKSRTRTSVHKQINRNVEIPAKTAQTDKEETQAVSESLLAHSLTIPHIVCIK